MGQGATREESRSRTSSAGRRGSGSNDGSVSPSSTALPSTSRRSRHESVSSQDSTSPTQAPLNPTIKSAPQAVPAAPKPARRSEGAGNSPQTVFGSPLLSPARPHAKPRLPPLEAPDTPPLSPTSFSDGEESPVEGLVRHEMRWCGREASRVMVAGSFNKWGDPVKLTKTPSGAWVGHLNLKPAVYEYKFIIDDKWKHDPTQPTIQNAFGSVNNLLHVTQASLEQSADRPTGDSLAREVDQDFGRELSDGATRPPTPPGEYSQVVPDNLNDRSVLIPRLPPQLLQVTLNSQSTNGDATQLPEPNHVCLNHLFALSVKDNVMVLGASHRYKKKFVTTVLYKPV